MSDPLTENYMTIFKISVWEQILGVQVFLVFDDEVGELEDRFFEYWIYSKLRQVSTLYCWIV